jgi:Mono-functional DNA-alkylating methyl methanesulfonate N-term
VQIRRLDRDGHFHDVARKNDFGPRIRNACVIGASAFEAFTAGSLMPFSQMQGGNGDVSMADDTGPGTIPPQFILLALESGDLIFLFARNVGADVEFITSHHRVVDRGIIEEPAMHLKVDPSSRYVAVAGSENTFAVYALRTKEDLSTQSLQGTSFSPVASEQYLHVRGVIHKMEFLFPSPDDPDHIILLLLVVRNGSTAMFVYEWAAGQSLTEIRSNNLKGHTLPPGCRMPLLLIPLTIMSALLFVCADSIMECHSVIEGTPAFRNVPQPEFPASQIHIGIGMPLWTAWTRPLRHHNYSKGHDDIYIAREDGFIAFLEVVLDSSVLVQTTIAAGNFRSNIGTAFTNLQLAESGKDFLIAGGDSCDGGSYLVS